MSGSDLDAAHILHSPAAQRNREPILDRLQPLLPGPEAQATVLEIASGTGEHIAFFASALSHLQWQPSDPDPAHRRSINARCAQEGLTNVAKAIPVTLSAGSPNATTEHPKGNFAAVIVANLLHISPPSVTAALCFTAASLLQDDELLHVYGPFTESGRYRSAGDERFDASLKQRNPLWGIRDRDWVISEAEAEGFVLASIAQMPANNLSLEFRRS